MSAPRFQGGFRRPFPGAAGGLERPGGVGHVSGPLRLPRGGPGAAAAVDQGLLRRRAAAVPRHRRAAGQHGGPHPGRGAGAEKLSDGGRAMVGHLPCEIGSKSARFCMYFNIF